MKGEHGESVNCCVRSRKVLGRFFVSAGAFLPSVEPAPNPAEQSKRATLRARPRSCAGERANFPERKHHVDRTRAGAGHPRGPVSRRGDEVSVMPAANPSEDKRDDKGRFIVPPKSPGRPKGSRNKLGEAFLADMLSDWEEHGIATIATVREEKPEQYLKVVASVLPKELNLRVNDFDDLTDEQLARQLASIATQLANAGFGLGEGTGQTEAPEQPGAVSTLQ